MSIKWKLRSVMAKNDIWSGSELKRLMEDVAGYPISNSSISSLMKEKPKMIRTDTLDALCTVLNCTPNDLIHHESSNLGMKNDTERLTPENEKTTKKTGTDRSLPPV